METLSENRCFGGVQGVYSHDSRATGTQMTFGLFLPEEAQDGPVPLLWYLSGLTCTHENAMVKAGAQAHAAAARDRPRLPRHLAAGRRAWPTTRPSTWARAPGFYLDATEAPWAPHFQMKSYVLGRIARAARPQLRRRRERQSITGHSMGGHGALTLAMAIRGGSARSRPSRRSATRPTSDWGPQAVQRLSRLGRGGARA